MYFDELNFLSASELEVITKRVEKFYKLSKEEYAKSNLNDTYTFEEGRHTPGIAEQKAYRVRFWTHKLDADSEYIGFFGKEIEPLLTKMREYFHNNGIFNIKLTNVWLQYGDINTKMDRHTDGHLKNAPPEKCYTSTYFCHSHWDDNWGGQFNLAEQGGSREFITFSANPNRLLMWTREHHHWMTPITQICPKRMFIGTSWYE